VLLVGDPIRFHSVRRLQPLNAGLQFSLAPGGTMDKVCMEGGGELTVAGLRWE